MSMQSIEAVVGNLEARVTNLETELKSANAKLDSIQETLATAKGGWRMLILVGSIVAGIVTIIATVFGGIHK